MARSALLLTSAVSFGSAVLALVLVACATSATPEVDGPPPADGGPDRDATPPSPQPPLGKSDATPTTGTDCERRLSMGKLRISQSTCFVNQHVENKTTKLSFPCAGGKAKAEFDGHLFEGTVQGEVVSLKNVEPFVFNQCEWISTETIDGDLSKGTLRYQYSERPKTTCPDRPCTANGDVDVEAGEIVVVR